MVVKTSLIYGLFVVLVIIGMAWLGSSEIQVIAPANSTNNSGTIAFNVSYINNTDVKDPLNATFYYNLSGTWTIIGYTPATACLLAAAGTVVSCNTSLSTTSLTDGVWSINASLTNASTALLGRFNATLGTHFVTFDNTVPQANITSPVSRGNHSGTLVLNSSVLDVTLSVGTVFFNITNSTGHQNATFTSNNVAGNAFNASISTANFPDGYYNITIFANDTSTGGNLNKTTVALNVIFDNTKPTVSVSCTPNPVTQDDTITCTCTRSDATSGVKTVSHDTTPSTAETGSSFTNTCTVTDHAGNSADGSFDYTVEGAGGGGTTGGGTTGSGGTTGEPDLAPEVQEWENTFEFIDQDFSDIGSVTQELGELERIIVMVSGETHHVGVVSIGEDSAVIEIASHAGQVEFSVGNSREFDVDEDGTFYDLRVTLVSIDAGKANVMVEYIQEEIPQPPEPTPPTTPEEAAGLGALFWVLIIVVVIIVIVIVFWMRRREA